MPDNVVADNLFSKIDTLAAFSSNQHLQDVVSATSVRSLIEKMWGIISGNATMPIQLPSTTNVSGLDYVKKIRLLIDGSGNARMKQMFDASPLAALAGSRSTDDVDRFDDEGAGEQGEQGAGGASINDFFKHPNIQEGFKMFQKYTSRGNGGSSSSRRSGSDSINDSSSSSSSSSDPDDDNSGGDSASDNENDRRGSDDTGDVLGTDGASHPLTPSELLALGVGQNSCLSDVNTQTLQGFLKIVKAPHIPTKRGPLLRMAEEYNHPTAENLTVRALSIIDGDRAKSASLIAAVTQHTNRIVRETREFTPAAAKLFATAEQTLRSDMFSEPQRLALQSCAEELRHIQNNIDQEIDRVMKSEKKKTAEWSKSGKILTGLGITGGVALTSLLAKHMWAKTNEPINTNKVGDDEKVSV